MKHLETHDILEFLGGGSAPEVAVHADSCDECRRRVELWRHNVSDLRELESSRVDDLELHNLRVLFRELGPGTSSRRWLAHLVRGIAHEAEAAVRGGLSATFESWEAGPYQIVLQTRPSSRAGRFDIHGQVSMEGAAAGIDVQVVLTSDQGFADRTSLDEFGEFRLVEVPAGECRVVWSAGDESVEISALEVGEDDGAD